MDNQNKQEKPYIYLSPDYRVGSDNLNLILQKKKLVTNKTTQETKESWDTKGYFGTYKEIMHSIVDKQILEAKTLEDIVLKIEKLHKMIKDFQFSLNKKDKEK